jgi:uncharacterized protein (DUF885 family)
MKVSKRLISLFITLLLIASLTSCTEIQDIASTTQNNDTNASESFDNYLNSEFKEYVTNDSITLHYTIKNPSAYGIEDFKPTLGDMDLATLEKENDSAEDDLAKLREFNYNDLTDDQKLSYDILEDHFKTEEKAKGLTYYQDALSPTLGIQAQLPVTLAEYKFYSKQDVDNYIQILNLMKAYFQNIIGFEQAKSQKGLFMSDSTVDEVINQCNEFIKDPKNNYLIKTFDNRLNTLTDITDDEKNAYKASNEKAVLEEMIPCYQNLITELTKLKGTGKNQGGLSNFEKGKDYYEYLVASETGTDKSISELTDILDTRIKNVSSDMMSIINKSPDLLNVFGKEDYGTKDPAEIISILKDRMKAYYPEAPDVDCQIKYVDESLESNSTPAFYMTPPIDAFESNVIYINKTHTDDATLFPTLAHEGYPGHLYQTTYFNSTKPNPIRNALNFGGYTEGWATYVELQSYEMSNLDNQELVKLLKLYSELMLALPTRIDIGVNYEGWDSKKTEKYISSLGLNSESAGRTYQYVIQEPANYLKYYIGFLEFNSDKVYAQKQLGNKFDLKAFNKVLLDVGPAPFSIVRKKVDKYISEQ